MLLRTSGSPTAPPPAWGVVDDDALSLPLTFACTDILSLIRVEIVLRHRRRRTSSELTDSPHRQLRRTAAENCERKQRHLRPPPLPHPPTAATISSVST